MKSEKPCERHSFPYRPKGLPESCWDQQETYYVKDPDAEYLSYHGSYVSAKTEF